MPRSVQLHVPAPCQQSWAAMTPAGPGRHCAACQQVVVDFTQKTDGEILAYLAQAGATSCGRFRADQLRRPLVPPAAPSRWRSWLASALALGGVLGAGRAAAQAGGNYFSAGPTPTLIATPSGGAPAGQAARVAPAPVNEPTEPALTTIRGVVLEAGSNQPLPGAIIQVKGTQLGTTTAADGSFALPIPSMGRALTLVVEFIGYERMEQRISAKALSRSARIKLVAHPMVLGGLGYEVAPAATRGWLARVRKAMWG